MIVEAIEQFKDIKSDTMRIIGERFEVTPERFAEINGTHYGELVKEVVDKLEDEQNDTIEDIVEDIEADMSEDEMPRRTQRGRKAFKE